MNNNHKHVEIDVQSNVLRSTIIWLLVFLFHFFTIIFVRYEYLRLPEPKFNAFNNNTEFSESNGREFLLGLVQLGTDSNQPRSVGSYENEVLAVNYLKKTVSSFPSAGVHKVEIDVQKASGTFQLDFLDGYTSNYENIQNFVVRLSTKYYVPEDSLMVNCHFDSIPGSPAASDDAVSCALMLELIRCLLQRKEPLQHSIVFNFNGAEENILQGSHAFITQHPWAKNIRAFVNLEAAGAGGREMVFQTGPDHPWLIKAYASVAPYPMATTIAQEIFESGFIPSDTDFRIYRDYGKIPGIDIAYIVNGYVYHTQYDIPSLIPPGCIQRSGDNLLALVTHLADAEELADTQAYKHGSVVFFDFIGFFIVLYPQRIGDLMNYTACFLSLITLLFAIKKGFSYRRSNPVPKWYFPVALLVILVGFVLVLLTILVIAKAMDFLGYSMFWFNYHFNVVGIFIVPACFVVILVHSVAKKFLFRNSDMWTIERLFFFAALFIWTIILFFLTFNNISSSFLALFAVIFPLVIRYYLTVFLLQLDQKSSPIKFLCLHFLACVLPTIMLTYMFVVVKDFFIPLMGRVGQSVIPDIFIGVIFAIAVCFLSLYHCGLVYISGDIRPVLKFLFCFFVFNLAFVLFTPLGFPYQKTGESYRVQRHVIHHISREYYDYNGFISKKDSGIWLVPFDHNRLRHLHGNMAGIEEFTKTTCSGPYCGWPYYFPMLPIASDTYFRPAPPPPSSELLRVTSKLLDRDFNPKSRIVRFSFSMDGPDHFNLYIAPLPGVDLVKWSMGTGKPFPTSWPPFDDMLTYFVYYAHGSKPEEPWKFWLELKINEQLNWNLTSTKPLIQMAIAGFGLHGKALEDSEVLVNFKKTLPEWATPLCTTVHYQMHFY